MKILGLKNHVMILGEERERTKGSPLARMDQLQRIYLPRIFGISVVLATSMVQKQARFTAHNLLQRILVDQDLRPDIQQRDRYIRDFRLNGNFVQPQRNALRLDGAKSHMSDRYFDCSMDCLEHMIFERTLEFFEELAIKKNKIVYRFDHLVSDQSRSIQNTNMPALVQRSHPSIHRSR